MGTDRRKGREDRYPRAGVRPQVMDSRPVSVNGPPRANDSWQEELAGGTLSLPPDALPGPRYEGIGNLLGIYFRDLARHQPRKSHGICNPGGTGTYKTEKAGGLR